jgi:hypothetical protein
VMHMPSHSLWTGLDWTEYCISSLLDLTGIPPVTWFSDWVNFEGWIDFSSPTYLSSNLALGPAMAEFVPKLVAQVVKSGKRIYLVWRRNFCIFTFMYVKY